MARIAVAATGCGFCPSCGGRRMADTAAHLIDRVLPEMSVRQWMLSLPFALRYRLGYDASLTTAVLGIFVRSVFASLRRRARKHWGIVRGRCGAVTFVQRFGDALNLNVHFHSLLLDGVYASGPSGAPTLPCASAAERCRSRAGGRRGGAAHRAPPRAARPRPRVGPARGRSPGRRRAAARRALWSLRRRPHRQRVSRGSAHLRIGDRVDPEDFPALEGKR